MDAAHEQGGYSFLIPKPSKRNPFEEGDHTDHDIDIREAGVIVIKKKRH